MRHHDDPTSNHMRNSRRTPVTLATTIALLVLASAPNATALNLDLDEAAALLVLPLITGHSFDTAATALTVTNAGSAVRLHINVLSGDPGDRWAAQDFDCTLTQSETVLFWFDALGDGSVASYECGGVGESGQYFKARNGVVVVSIEDLETGETRNTNQIFGDAIVIDYSDSTAYSVGAVSFQGIGHEPGVADRSYRFDNVEYAAFPSALATHYVPTDSASLVLFTLDGTTDVPETPPAAVGIRFSNGAGGFASASHSFDCFDIVDLKTIDGRFGFPGIPREGRFLTLTPEPVTYPNLAHDVQFDGGAGGVLGVRRPPVHGWLFQKMTTEGGTAAFGRTLNQSELPFAPMPGDAVVFNAH